MLYRHSDVGSKKETEWGIRRFHYEAVINIRSVGGKETGSSSEKTKH